MLETTGHLPAMKVLLWQSYKVAGISMIFGSITVKNTTTKSFMA